MPDIKKIQINGTLYDIKTETDSVLNESSKNPIENKAVYEALNTKSQIQIITWGADD